MILDKKTKTAVELVIVLMVAAAFTVWLTWPLTADLQHRAVELGDSLLTAYFQAWDTHALTTHAPLFDTNMFYPAKDTLALSENLLGNQIVFAPIYLTSKNPILASNTVIVSSFFFCALAAYALVRYVTGNVWAGAIAAVVFAFSPVRLSQLSHMQLLSMYWMPLIMLFLMRYMDTGRFTDLFGLALSVAMQILCSLYLGYMAILVALATFLALAITCPRWFTLKRLGGLILAAVAVGITLLPVLNPYRKLQATSLNADDNAYSTIVGSASPIASYLEGSGKIYGKLFTRYHSTQLDWEKHLFTGLVPLLLAGFAVFRYWAGRRGYRLLTFRDSRVSLWAVYRHRLNKGEEISCSSYIPASARAELLRPLVWAASFILIGSYILSLGPILRIHDRITEIHLPFYALQQVVPGMGTFRVPARFGLSYMLGLGILAGIGLMYLLDYLKSQRYFGSVSVRAALALVIVLLVGFEFNIKFWTFPTVMTPGNVAPEYLWIRDHMPNVPLLELPLSKSRTDRWDPYTESGYLYASTFHWRDMVNGYSGHVPTTFNDMFTLAQEIPAVEPTNMLAGLGVQYVVLHTGDLSTAELQRWDVAEKGGWLRRVASFPHTVIYELAPTHCTASPKGTTVDDMEVPASGKPGKPFGLTVLFSTENSCWTDPTRSGESPVSVTWMKSGSSEKYDFHSQVTWPLYLSSAVPRQVAIKVPSPDADGTFKMSLDLGPYHLAAPRDVALEKTSSAYNSLDAPTLLRAEYDLRSAKNKIGAGQSLDIVFVAKNTGRSVWLATGQRGFVGLGYSWWTPDGVEVTNGRAYLPYDIYPGDQYTFRTGIVAPSQPGKYILRLDLVSELVVWFGDQGSSPVKLSVEVTP